MELTNRNWWKKCRVCNKEGSKYIFLDRMPTTSTSTSLQTVTVSSTERLLEKLRFVTMIKIDEFDNKPKMLCDLCIIQLNVSYHFKTLAMEMDTKHQQYIIENGISHSPNSDNNTLQYIEHSTFERSSTTLRPLALPANFSSFHQLPSFHRLIKSEPTDYEIMSDITIDTNTDRVDDQINTDNNNAYNQRFDGVNMVCVNDLDLLRSNGDSDIEFINNCLPASYRQYEKPANTMTTTTHQSTTTTIGSQLVIATSKPINKISNFPSSNHRHVDTRQLSNSVEQLSESVSKNSSSISNAPPKSNRKHKPKKDFPGNGHKKTLRPKTIGNINYSLVKRHKNERKVINPMNKMRQIIKKENESTRRPSTANSSQKLISTVDRRLAATNPKSRSILMDKRKRGQRKKIEFATSQKGNKHEIRNTSYKPRITIRETDRFKFASISSIKRVKSTGN